ncbi:discoidin domain-containing protein [Meridianimarinicoccus sp. RP-17]|uniref:discoidin domain-containing protein n=1 Tax=Meridianimarinicoccus zhengii TaxID=2056810 RepID=UPI0013A6F0E8|nr:discoidin domain-containing protein [Phycocomes zhengii]
MKTVLSAVLAVVLLSVGAQAASIVSAVSVTASSERALVPASATINQSGLSASYVSGVTDFDTYLGSNPTHTLIARDNEWFSDFGNLTPTLTFDLGAVLTIDRIALWVEESSGFSTAALSSSTDGVTFGSLGTINPADNPLADYPAEVFGIATTAMRYFRMDFSGCPQPDPGSTDECSLGEIAFSSVDPTSTPIPIPAGAILLGSALATGLAATRRTRRQG